MVSLADMTVKADITAKYSESGSLPDNVTRVLDEASSELSRGQIDLILRIVPAVSYSTEKKLRAAGGWGHWHDTCAELHAVQDADRLDAIGAIGVLRCAAFSGARNRILLEDEPNTPSNSCEGHFYDKLLKIKDLMKVGLELARDWGPWASKKGNNSSPLCVVVGCAGSHCNRCPLLAATGG